MSDSACNIVCGIVSCHNSQPSQMAEQSHSLCSHWRWQVTGRSFLSLSDCPAAAPAAPAAPAHGGGGGGGVGGGGGGAIKKEILPLPLRCGCLILSPGSVYFIPVRRCQ
jgi:hypothetical protein